MFRRFLPITLIVGGLWMVYHNSPSLTDILLNKEYVSYQQLVALQALKTSVKSRWRQLWLSHRGPHDPKLPNEIYCTKLESDLLYLQAKGS